jgi:hypothetical protein
MTGKYDYANAFISGDYKTKLKTLIDDLFARAKRGEPELADRSKRMKLIEDLTEAYVTQTGERPDPTQLDRLATLILREELTDATPWKTRNTEYPITSERQEDEYAKKRVPLSAAIDRGVDGDSHGLPTRRKRSKAENAYMDRSYKGRGKR